MDFFLMTLAILWASIFVYYILSLKKKTNLPPGPGGALPILGNIFPKGVPIFTTLGKFVKKYGPILTVRMGSNTTILLSESKLIREAFNHSSFNGRPNNKVFWTLSNGNYGILGTDGELWYEQRRFTTQHLKHFRFRKNEMESLILEEAKELINTLQSDKNCGLDPSKRFSLAILNSLWVVMIGKRYSLEDETVQKLMETHLKELDKAFATTPLFFFPLLADIVPEWSGYNNLKRAIQGTQNLFTDKILEHSESMTPENPRDFIDAYLVEIEQAEDNHTSSFFRTTGHKNLLALISDLFTAGSDTTSATLTWGILYLAVHTETQTRLHEEIDRVIGPNRLPSLADRPNMPYTQALMYEVLRKSSVAPLAVIHRATEDTVLAGYQIPKDSYVIANLHYGHHNTEYWAEPWRFNPDRFLVNEANGRLKVQKSENLIPFSTGKRMCPGESLAMDHIFLFLTSIYQRLDVTLDLSYGPPSLEPQNTLVARPFPYYVITKER